jgi:hypothetical protein
MELRKKTGTGGPLKMDDERAFPTLGGKVRINCELIFLSPFGFMCGNFNPLLCFLRVKKSPVHRLLEGHGEKL